MPRHGCLHSQTITGGKFSKTVQESNKTNSLIILGRRTSTIRGGMIISACMLTIGAIYASHADATPAGRWSIIALIYIFVIAYGMSWAVVLRIYCSEIQPTKTRAAATSLGQCCNWVCSIVHFLLLVHTGSSLLVKLEGRQLDHCILHTALPLPF